MKTYKVVDFYIQLFLFLAIAVSTILSTDSMFVLLTGYLIIGGYQLAGMLIHELTKAFTAVAQQEVTIII